MTIKTFAFSYRVRTGPPTRQVIDAREIETGETELHAWQKVKARHERDHPAWQVQEYHHVARFGEHEGRRRARALLKIAEAA